MCRVCTYILFTIKKEKKRPSRHSCSFHHRKFFSISFGDRTQTESDQREKVVWKEQTG